MGYKLTASSPTASARARRVAAVIAASLLLGVSAEMAGAATPRQQLAAYEREVELALGEEFGCMANDTNNRGRRVGELYVTTHRARRRARAIARRRGVSGHVSVRKVSARFSKQTLYDLTVAVARTLQQLPADQRQVVGFPAYLSYSSARLGVRGCRGPDLAIFLRTASAETIGWAMALQALFGADRLPLQVVPPDGVYNGYIGVVDPGDERIIRPPRRR